MGALALPNQGPQADAGQRGGFREVALLRPVDKLTVSAAHSQLIGP